jgi:hypothetical protein
LEAGSHEQKFFASFFQKRRSSNYAGGGADSAGQFAGGFALHRGVEPDAGFVADVVEKVRQAGGAARMKIDPGQGCRRGRAAAASDGALAKARSAATDASYCSTAARAMRMA